MIWLAFTLSWICCMGLGFCVAVTLRPKPDLEEVYRRGFERCKMMVMANRPCRHCRKMPLEHDGVYCNEPPWSSRLRSYSPESPASSVSQESTHV